MSLGISSLLEFPLRWQFILDVDINQLIILFFLGYQGSFEKYPLNFFFSHLLLRGFPLIRQLIAPQHSNEEVSSTVR